jgi:hypothetical protein
MIQTVNTFPVKRRRRSSAVVAALLSALEQSGRSMRDYCRQHQMPVSNFSSMLRRHAGRHSSARALPAAEPHVSATAKFFPVEIVEDRRAAAVAVKSSALFVEMPGGIRIAVEQDFDGLTLRRLVAALGRE